MPRLASRALLAVAVALGLPGAAPSQALAPLRALDPADLDRGADPCTDFWRFANGGWLDRTTLPDGEGAFSLLDELEARNEQTLRTLLEETATAPAAPPGSRDRVLGDFWCACMDADAVDAQGVLPVSDLLGRINSIVDRGDLRFVLSYLQLQGLPLVLRVQSEPALDAPEQLVPWIRPAGLGLPDAGDYSRGDEASQRRREEYVGHIAAMLALAGAEPEQAAQDAAAAMAIETALAAHTRGEDAGLAPARAWNPRIRGEIDALWPGLLPSELLDRMGMPRVERLNFVEPEFCVELARLAAEEPLEAWRAWLRWRVLDLSAPTLGRAFQAEDFRFRGRFLAGAKQPPPRWQHCLREAQASLGDVLGQAFADRALSAATAERGTRMAEALRGAMRERILAATWLGGPARLAALDKLEALVVHVGAPASGPDTSWLVTSRDGHAANVQLIAAWRLRRELQRLHRPADRALWPLPPFAADALCVPWLNAVFVPAGLLQPPFLDAAQDEAASFGALGSLLGHEIAHGFDAAGSRFDATGRLHEWLGEEDQREFERRTQPLARHVSTLLGVDALHVDGELTLDETLADLAGVRIAFEAFRAASAGAEDGDDASGFTPEQRFALAAAQARRELAGPELQRWRLRHDPHAPAPLRALLSLQDLPELRAAFGCAPQGTRLGLW